MPVLNDFGDEGYARVVAQLDKTAADLGIPKEIIRQYWSDTAHLPQTLNELKAWGMKPDREYGQTRYDPATGRWTPLGTGPTPGKTDQERGGFPHFITNNVGEAQRFQQVDENGNIYGGSWDPAYNAANPGAAMNTQSFRAPGAQRGFVAGGPTARAQVISPADMANPPGQPFNPSAPMPPPNQMYPLNPVDGSPVGGDPSAPPPQSGSPVGAPPASAVGGGGGVDPSGGYGQYNSSAAELAALSAFRNRELDQLRLPQFEFQKDYSNRQLSQQNDQFMANLQQQAEEIKARYGEAAAQRHVQEVLGRGNLALGGLGLASQEAISRMNVGLGGLDVAARDAATRMSTGVAGLNAAEADAAARRAAGVAGAGQASSEAVGRINAGVNAYQGAEAAAQNRINAGITAYGQAGQQALGAGQLGLNAAQGVDATDIQKANILAGLRGSGNAFQQMKVAGFIAPNLARALAGEAGVPGFQASQGTPTPAGLSDVGLSNDQSEAQRLQMQYARQGLNPYESDAATRALMTAGRVGDDPYAGQGTQGLLRLGQQGENPYDSASQRQNLAYGEQGLNPYDSQIARTGQAYADRGLNDAYGSDVGQMGQAYGRMGQDPYNSPTIQGALGMAAPNAQYAIPGSATSQIPGLAGNVNTALQQLRDTNYGLPQDPVGGINTAIQALRGDPAYAQVTQRASAGDQAAVQQMRQMEGNAVAQATGLDPAQGLQLITSWRSKPGMRTPDELAASVNPMVADVRLRKETGVLQQVAGLNPQEASDVIQQLRQGTNTTGQPSSPEQIERILAARLGQQGMANQLPPGTGSFGQGGATPTMSAQVMPGSMQSGPQGMSGAGLMTQEYRAPGGAGMGLGQGMPQQRAPDAFGRVLESAGPQMVSGAGMNPILRRGGTPMGVGAGAERTIAGPMDPNAQRTGPMGGQFMSSPMGAAAPMSGAPPPQMPGQMQSFAPMARPTGGQPMQMGQRAPDAYGRVLESSPMGLAAPQQPVPDAAAVARQYTGGVAPNQINSAAFGRLPKSAQQFTLGAYEAQGYDQGDVLETIQRTLPKAVGARRGFTAPAY